MYKNLFQLEIENEEEEEDEGPKYKNIEIEKLSKINKNDSESYMDKPVNVIDKSGNKLNDNDKSTHPIAIKTYFDLKKQENKKKTTISLNENLKDIVKHKKRIRQNIEINKYERFCYFICSERCYKNFNQNERRIRYELALAADNILEKKSDIFEFWNLLDQFRLLTKIFLNENQCFMIKNRDPQLITNKFRDEFSETKLLDKEKFEKNVNTLKGYIDKKKEKNELTEVDNILLSYLQDDILSKINNK